MIESVELKEKEMKGLSIIIIVVIIVNTILMNWTNMKTMMEKIAMFVLMIVKLCVIV